jgi:hypothetical protein
MGKASSSKKVARAARTGGGRTRRGSSSWLWPSLMAVIVVVGTAGVVYSREQRQPDTSRPLASGAGRQGDHWHAAIGYYICGTFAPNISEAADPLGIHTHDDGVVHTHPFTSRSAGTNARLGLYFETANVKVTTDELEIPGQTKKNGQECDGKPAKVQVKVWQSRDPSDEGTIFVGDPNDIRLGNNQLITVAFVPEGTDIPRPPSEANLDKLTDLGPQPTTTLPAEGEATTVPPEGATTTAPAPPPDQATTTPPPAP